MKSSPKAIKTIFKIHDIFSEADLNPDETLLILSELIASGILAYKIKYEIDKEEFILDDIKRIIKEMSNMKGTK